MLVSSYKCYGTNVLLILLIVIVFQFSIISSTVIYNNNDLYKPARSRLASKLIFESPKMDNIYKEYLVSSKPLQLRKHRHSPKMKRSKKDSRIFYISMPSLSYRLLPDKSYKREIITGNIRPSLSAGYVATHKGIEIGKLKNKATQLEQPLNDGQLKATIKDTDSNTAQSTIHNLERHDLNGRPARLQVYHSGPKLKLTPKNLKRNLYVIKKIIY